MLSDLTCKVKEGEILHPVVVVHHNSGVGILRLEVEKLSHLLLDTFLVVTQGLIVEQVALLALTRGVANHTCGTTHENHGTVSATLQVTQHHDTAQVTDMQRVSRGVGTQIGCYHFFLEQLFCAWHHLCQHAAPFQFFNKVLFHIFFYLFTFLSLYLYGTGS